MKKNLFEELKASLQEVVDHKKKKIHLRSESIDIPQPPAEYDQKEIKNIRISIACSQGVFAKLLNVSIKTVQSWESGQRSPSHSALRLIELIDKGIYRPHIYKKK